MRTYKIHFHFVKKSNFLPKNVSGRILMDGDMYHVYILNDPELFPHAGHEFGHFIEDLMGFDQVSEGLAEILEDAIRNYIRKLRK